MIQSRVFNDISVSQNVLTKTSDDDSLRWELEWYRNIPSTLRDFVPEIYTYGANWIDMEYVKGRTLHEIYISGEYGIDAWKEILFEIKDFTDAMNLYTVKAEQEALDTMYVTKTMNRLNALKNHPTISRYFKEEPVINGVLYPCINEVIDQVSQSVSEMEPCETFSIIHGDLHFANIILRQHGICAVDPRGQFGRFITHGDPRYDIAKLYHSIEGGYDYIIEDMFYLDTQDGIDYGLDVPEYGFDMMNLIRKTFDYNERDVRLIESLLFLSMIPLHPESVSRQTVMFARGMELFGRAIR